MSKPISTRRSCGLMLCTLAVLQGCTSYISKGLADDGKTATELVFPPIRDARQSEGSFPNKDNLRAVGAGMSKDQLYELLGPPHFNEGLVAVREWDYIFHFRSGGGVLTCRYKVLFDRDYRARSFRWDPLACAGLIAERPLPLPAAKANANATSKAIQQSADALFAFDRAALQDPLPQQRGEPDPIATVLGGVKVELVRIGGHADRRGTAPYNQQLS